MVFGHHYGIRLVCNRGSYTWGDFIALTEGTQTLVITANMFPSVGNYKNVTFNVLRKNDTWIQMNYTDALEATTWFYTEFQVMSGYTYQTMYYANSSGYAGQVNWYSAMAATNYRVLVTARYDTSLITFSAMAPTLASTSAVFTGLEALGDWPFLASNFIGACILLAVFAAFTYVYMPAGCVVGVIVGAIEVYFGILAVPTSLLSLAGAIAILYGISEAKKGEIYEV
jgi:hypothetical protein